MKTKQFKIGECAIGGIVKVTINKSSIVIQAIDYFSKEIILNNEFTNTQDSFWEMKEYVWNITTSYYTDKIMEYITENSTINFNQFR